MTILVTGSTGLIGSRVVQGLSAKGKAVRALARDISKVPALPNVEAFKGDLTDVVSVREALKGVDTVFLLNGVVSDETAQVLMALELAREAGIKGIVYFSVYNSHLNADVPHIASKHLAERAIEALSLPATILRPAYFMQNDLMLRVALDAGVYPQPVGGIGVAMVDIRDVVDMAIVELVRHQETSFSLPRETIDIVGPDTLTGADIATVWSEVLGKPISYMGDDLGGFEARAATMFPGWIAHDLRMMFQGFQRNGIVPSEGVRKSIEGIIGHPLRSYRMFAEEAATAWRAAA